MVGRAVLELRPTTLPMSLVASQGAVVPPRKTQRFWRAGKWKEKEVSGGMRPAGQGRPLSPGALCGDATMVLKFSCSALKGFGLGKIF